MPVVLKGAEQLQASLDRAGVEMETMARAHSKVSDMVAAAVRAPRKSGRLAGSVQAQPMPARASVGAGVPYAHIIEYGTPRVRAHPYLRPAFESTLNRWVDVYSAELQDILGRVRGA